MAAMLVDYVANQIFYDGIKKLLSFIILPFIEVFIDLNRIKSYEVKIGSRTLHLGKFVGELIYIILVLVVLKMVLKTGIY